MSKHRGSRDDDMSTGDVFRALANHRKALRATYGMNCPQCAINRPRASPSILLPRQRFLVNSLPRFQFQQCRKHEFIPHPLACCDSWAGKDGATLDSEPDARAAAQNATQTPRQDSPNTTGKP